MNRNFRLTDEAQADLLAIWSYLTDDDSEEAADRVIARIFDECQKLGETPTLGRSRVDLLEAPYRFWRVWSYLIAYHSEATPILIIAVVHGARDLDIFFDDRAS